MTFQDLNAHDIDEANTIDLVDLGQRALRRLAFVDLRLAQLEADCRSLATGSRLEGGEAQLHTLLEQLLAAVEHSQSEQRAAFQSLCERLDELDSGLTCLRQLVANSDTGEQPDRCQPRGTPVGWEGTKQRLLECWEEESAEGPQRQQPESASPASLIDQPASGWNELLAAKEQEIASLKAQLAEWQEQWKSVEENELVRQEQERLLELQRTWEAKLRQAEVEISIERAKLARERTELEEKLRNIEALQTGPSSGVTAPARKSRWLSQLGLSD